VGVPGPWRNREELTRALTRFRGEYLFAGLVFRESSSGAACEFELQKRTPELRQAVEIAGQGAFADEDLRAVDRHKTTAWLVFDQPGLETARTAARFARALLEAGGVAVKVDSAGLAHTRERWLRDWDDQDPRAIYALFVTLVGGEGIIYSCGMQNFALPDTAVPMSLGEAEAAQMINIFNLYQVFESPELESGNTFSLDADSPSFRVMHETYVDGYQGTTLENPHGLWMLHPLAPEPPREPSRPERRRWRLPWT